MESEWGLISTALVALLGTDALRQHHRAPRHLSPALLIRVLRAALLRGANLRPPRAAAVLRRALAAAVKDR